MCKMNKILLVSLLILSALVCSVISTSLIFSKNISGLSRKGDESTIKLEDIVQNNDILDACLLVAQDYFTGIDRNKANEYFDVMVNNIQERIKGVNDPKQVVKIINKYLFEELNITSVGDSSDVRLVLPSAVFENKRGHCMSFSVIYVAIAERLQLPIFAKIIPRHIFVCYDDGQTKFNIETTSGGDCKPDSYYRRFFPYPEQNPCDAYFRKLGKGELLGVFLLNLANHLEQDEKALDACGVALSLFPELPEIHSEIGHVNLRLGNIKKAETFLVKSLQIDPTMWRPHYDIGLLYLGSGDFEKSINASLKAIDLLHTKVTTPLAHVTVNLIEARTEDHNLIEEVTTPLDHVEVNLMGARTEDHDLIELAKKILEKKDVPFEHLFAFGLLSFENKEYELAYKLLARALEFRADNSLVNASLAATCFHLGNYDDARKYNKMADEKLGYSSSYSPGYFMNNLVVAYINLGEAYKMLNKYDLSIESFNKMIEIGGPSTRAYTELGDVYSSKRDRIKAIEYYEKALKLNPADEGVRKKLSNINADNERTE